MINYKAELENILQEILLELGYLDSKESLKKYCILKQNLDICYGNYTSVLVMRLAKQMNYKVENLGNLVKTKIENKKLKWLLKVDFIKPGFLNFFINDLNYSFAIKQIIESNSLSEVLEIPFLKDSISENLKDRNFTKLTLDSKEKKINLEFVSANPTGPLHIGHARGAALGSYMHDLIKAFGYNVRSEYYVNDAGLQIDILVLSVWLRYIKVDLTDSCYSGNYLQEYVSLFENKNVDNAIIIEAKQLVEKDDISNLLKFCKKFCGEKYASIKEQVFSDILAKIKGDLLDFRVEFSDFCFESHLIKNKMVSKVVNQLARAGYVYEKDGAKWFRSSDFGDEKDRVLIRSNGEYTYFTNDIANHVRKYDDGYDILVDIFGADHHGYVPRLVAALQALGYSKDRFFSVIVQFVSLSKDGKNLAMSTRGAKYITLKQINKQIGVSASRYFFLSKKINQAFNLDIDQAIKQDMANPLFYIQYAYARINSLVANAKAKNINIVAEDLENLDDEEIEIIRMTLLFAMYCYKSLSNFDSSILSQYLYDLSTLIHSFYNKEKIVDIENIDKSSKHLAVLTGAAKVIKLGLNLLRCDVPNKM